MVSRAELLQLARAIAQRAHCPYSHFHVGCALLAGDTIYTGVNIEISSYGLTLCAERAALAAAVSSGAGPVIQVAVACIDVPPAAGIAERTPCGACRQWLADLAPNAVIYLDGVERDFRVGELLPYAFGL